MEIKRSLELAHGTIDFFEQKIKATKWVYGNNRVNYYEDRIEAIKTLIEIVTRFENIKWPEKRFIPKKMGDAINPIQYCEDISYNEGINDCKKVYGVNKK